MVQAKSLNKAFQIPNNGLLSLFEDRQELCSGSLVQLPHINEVVVATAHHCFSKDAKESHNTVPGYSAGAMSVLVGTINVPGTKAVEFDTHQDVTYWNANLDIVFSKPSFLDKTQLPILKMAKQMPQIGEQIELEGFPVNLLSGTALRKHVQCRYLGPIEYATRHNKTNHELTLMQAVACPTNGIGVGHSGGPVTNAKNEFLGVISLMYKDDMLVRNELLKNNETLVVFSGASADLITPNYESGQYGLLNTKQKDITGIIVFRDVTPKNHNEYDGSFSASRHKSTQHPRYLFELVRSIGQKITVDLKEGVYHGQLVLENKDGQNNISYFVDGKKQK